MATIDESTVHHHHQIGHLQPLSPRVPRSTDRHFEQYLIDHHHYPKLPSIFKQTPRHPIEDKNLSSSYQRDIPTDYEHHTGSINRLLNSEQYRRSHARLIEYRQYSKIPGIALKPTTTTNNFNDTTLNGRNELILPLKEVFIETTRTKQHQNQDEMDLVDDDSIISDETDRRQRAKHWIKEHQFFFTEYQ
jgi:hypothetical protein